MSESIHAPHPVKQPSLTRKFPLTDMPAGLMASLVTRFAETRAFAAGAVRLTYTTPSA